MQDLGTSLHERHKKFNESTGKWLGMESILEEYGLRNDYEYFHAPKKANDSLRHYQAKQRKTLLTNFWDGEYYARGHIDGKCISTLEIQFFDDLKGTFPAQSTKEGMSFDFKKMVIYIFAAFGGLVFILIVGAFIKKRLKTKQAKQLTKQLSNG